ncbi:MAG: HNH endonuclease [Candidatus Viridilinea halotolerans]|uniref:HNH endonuclease n=1 Tax=Candidatus Viridilinea halotolerans TaxID=2491704 RepID=A0A426TZM9_9CHLR|nr:MAG: HNH endonuclease [Candidatus Viridilinea halotolerans]
MSKSYIPKALRTLVAAQGQYRCGYCLTQERVVGVAMEVEHLIPEILGGPTEEANLWLACSLCNNHKADRVAGIDPLTGEAVSLFDPRRQVWQEHFAWEDGGTIILGRTPQGRATVTTLSLNRVALVRARRLWVSVGWHSPNDTQ